MSAGLIKSALLSLLFFVVLVGAWHLATLPKGERAPAPDEYAKLLGKGAKKSEGFPTPAQIGETIVRNLSEPFYDRGPNDKGVGIQLAHSLGRVGLGYLLAIVLAVPLGFGIGIGYFVWNEWNNLNLANVIFAILTIGVVGMALDLAIGRLQKLVTYFE